MTPLAKDEVGSADLGIALMRIEGDGPGVPGIDCKPQRAVRALLRLGFRGSKQALAGSATEEVFLDIERLQLD